MSSVMIEGTKDRSGPAQNSANRSVVHRRGANSSWSRVVRSEVVVIGGPFSCARSHRPFGLEDDGRDRPGRQVPVLVEPGVETGELAPHPVVLLGGGGPGPHRPAGTVHEDLGLRVGLQVEPPG